MKPPIIIKKMGRATYREFAGVATNNFSASSDEAILAGTRAVISQHAVSNLRPFAKKILSKRYRITEKSKPVFGTILWGELCGWKPKYLRVVTPADMPKKG